mgnify:CR=1 FL=1
MDYLKTYKNKVFTRLFIGMLIGNILLIAVGYVGLVTFSLDQLYVYGLLLSIAVAYGLTASQILSSSLTKPIDSLSQAISYASNNSRVGVQPNEEKATIARELVHALSMEVYNLASLSPSNAETNSPTVKNRQFIDLLGVPIIGLDSDQKITTINSSACDYFAVSKEQAVGSSVYDVLKLSFQSDESLDDWIATSKDTSVTATHTWDRVRHTINQDISKQFDLVASFSSHSASGVETTLALYDRTDRYNRDDQEISFVALAVHELRTPLTVMRGYIEVFEDELGPQLDPEMTEFMHKMHASAQQLAAFVSNILNVARVEENQLVLKLRAEELSTVLTSAVADLELRASVHGKHIELSIAEDIPTIAADRISLHEIINNLVDNAIKYSGKSDKIIVSASMNSDGLVETSVQDFGIGIPSSVIGELFQKFHRSHKSKVQVGGTGLGLYLCKALVRAHGGNIWVRSKEGEGAIFSFTLIPYDQLSPEEVASEDGIIRGAHGWIKNHSLYRG